MLPIDVLLFMGSNCFNLVHFCEIGHLDPEFKAVHAPPPLQGLLFVSSNSGLVEVPVANCSNYQSCGECVLSRDPYCAWTGWLCQDVRMAPPDRLAIKRIPLFFSL